MSDSASTSKAAIAGESPAKESWVGRVAEGGRTWVRQAGTALRGDGTRFLEDAGEMLVKGGQVIMADGADPTLNKR